jgi:hypothetical protein
MTGLEGIAKYLDANIAELTFSETSGGNMFIDDMPATQAAGPLAVGVYGIGGYETDGSLPYNHGSFQVVVRGGKDPRVSRAMATRIYDQLQGLRTTELPGGVWVTFVLALQSAPIRLGPDELGNHKHSVNFRYEERDEGPHR